MTEVPERELADHTGDILDRVLAGEEIVVVRSDRHQVELRPRQRVLGVPWTEFWDAFEQIPSDPTFAADVHALTAHEQDDGLDPWERHERLHGTGR